MFKVILLFYFLLFFVHQSHCMYRCELVKITSNNQIIKCNIHLAEEPRVTQGLEIW